MIYPNLANIEKIIKKLNTQYHMDIVIVNRGQLEFALEKPKLSTYGYEQYPELYQKAAILMETITKSHTLSDGNKRTAIIVADFMIETNGGQLVLPLKTIRLSVDTAMDESDEMSHIIQKWFKIHTAMNNNQLCFMLDELVEEESIIRNMIDGGRFKDAEDIVSNWMAFDSYPEHKKGWDKLNDSWKHNKTLIDSKYDSDALTSKWQKMWGTFMSTAGHTADSVNHMRKRDIKIMNDLLWRDNSYETISKIESDMGYYEAKFTNAKDPDTVHKKGTRLEYVQKYSEAIEEYKRLIDIESYKVDALQHLGYLHYKRRQYDTALKYWIQYTTLKPDSRYGILMYARTLFRLGQYDHGIKVCENVSSKNMDIDIMLIMADCLIEQSRYDKAETILTTILKENPRNIGCYQRLGYISMEKLDYRKAIQYCDTIINLEPRIFHTYYNKAVAIGEMYKVDSAASKEQQELYKKSLKLNPKHVESWINLGSLLSNKGMWEEAINYLQKGRELNPNHEIALRNLGITYANLGNYDESHNNFDQLLQINPRDEVALFRKSTMYAQTGKVAECLACLEKLIKVNPKYQKKIRDERDKIFKEIKMSEKFQKLMNM